MSPISADDLARDSSLAPLFRVMKESGAGVLALTGREEDGTPRWALVMVEGPQESNDLLQALADLEDKWDSEAELREEMVAGKKS